MNVYLSGSKAFGAAVYRMLTERGHRIVGGCTPPWAGDGVRRDQLRHLIEDDARAPWLPAGSLRADMLPAGVDLLIAAHSHDWIGKATRHRCRAAIGYHPSLLPRHRGRSSVEWAIRMGDPITGGSVYHLDDRVDAGNVLCQDWCWIRPGDTPAELWRRDLFPMGVRLLEHAVACLDAYIDLPGKPQLEECATWEPAIDPPRIRRPDLPELPPATHR